MHGVAACPQVFGPLNGHVPESVSWLVAHECGSLSKSVKYPHTWIAWQEGSDSLSEPCYSSFSRFLSPNSTASTQTKTPETPSGFYIRISATLSGD
jgi:hypothetical protein